MIAVSLGVASVDEALRVVRALGAHRYVAGSLHLIHAFAFAAGGDAPELAAARAWAAATLAGGEVDPASRDERLWRRSSDAELGALLARYWTPGAAAQQARADLLALLRRHDLEAGDHRPFDEAAEEEMHPLLVDAGWELVPLARLDAERHRGAIQAFGEPIAFESARFEEETAIPTPVSMYELPAIGALELTTAAGDDGMLDAHLVVWVQGNETYVDYVMRGVRRAAKLPESD
jgi:hypothetical protein